MANVHSKISKESYDNMEESSYTPQKLVLYIEEYDRCTKEKDMCCFIMYDDYEEEFLIKGVRGPLTNNYTKTEHTFYCKKIKNIINYLESVVDETNRLQIVLYSYPNDEDMLYYYDFEDLYLKKVKKNKVEDEIVGYEDCRAVDTTFWNRVSKLLKNLKYVRF